MRGKRKGKKTTTRKTTNEKMAAPRILTTHRANRSKLKKSRPNVYSSLINSLVSPFPLSAAKGLSRFIRRRNVNFRNLSHPARRQRANLYSTEGPIIGSNPPMREYSTNGGLFGGVESATCVNQAGWKIFCFANFIIAAKLRLLFAIGRPFGWIQM